MCRRLLGRFPPAHWACGVEGIATELETAFLSRNTWPRDHVVPQLAEGLAQVLEPPLVVPRGGLGEHALVIGLLRGDQMIEDPRQLVGRRGHRGLPSPAAPDPPVELPQRRLAGMQR